jgi:predicted dehydrogenase
VSKLRVGIIGTGRISDLHALEYLQNERAEIIAVCDTDVELARRRGSSWGVPTNRVFSDYRELLELDEIDLVDILLPHHLHHPVTLAAARAGKHISVQKPMALSEIEADEMIEAAQAHGVILRVFENFLFYPPVQRAKKLVDAGEIGEPLTIRVKSNFGMSDAAWEVPQSAIDWRYDPARCGGGPIVFDDGHHKFALGWHFMGQAQEVHAWIGETELAPGYVVDSPAIVSWKFSGNRYGSLEAVHSPGLQVDTRQYPQDDRVEITGTDGVLWVTRGHGKMMDVPPVVLYRDGQTRAFADMPVGWEHSFINATRHLIDAYFEGLPPRLTGEEGREVLRFTLAAQASARSGRAIGVGR